MSIGQSYQINIVASREEAGGIGTLDIGFGENIILNPLMETRSKPMRILFAKRWLGMSSFRLILGLAVLCSFLTDSSAKSGDATEALGKDSHSVVLQWVTYSRELKKRGDLEGAHQALTQLIPQIPQNSTQGKNSIALVMIEILQLELSIAEGGTVEDSAKNAMGAIGGLESKEAQGEALLSIYPLLKTANSEGRYPDAEFVNFLGRLWENWPLDKKGDEEGLIFDAYGDLAVLLVKKGEREAALNVAGGVIEKWTGEKRQGNFEAMRSASMAVAGAHALGKNDGRGLFSDPDSREMLLGTIILGHAFKLAGEGNPEGKVIAGNLLGSAHLGETDPSRQPVETEGEQLELAMAAVASAGEFFKERGDDDMSGLFEKESRVLRATSEAKRYWWVGVLALLGIGVGFVVFFMMPVSFILGRVNRAKVKKIEDFLKDTVVMDIPKARAIST